MEKISVKKLILKELEQNKDKSISGESLAKKFDVSRAAVWKGINSLKAEGYEITAVTNKGYSLSDKSDVLSEIGIRQSISSPIDDLDIFVYKTIDSTNTQAKKLALENENRMIVVSEEQTSGRGRLGRSFYSPQKSGVYMSIVLHPQIEASNAILITTAVSVAVCRAIESFCDKEVKIKWVNDIFLDDKKICGILTEAVTNFETGIIDTIIIGIGINVSTKNEDFPEELSSIAGSILDEKDGTMVRNKLIGKIFDEVMGIEDNLLQKDFLKEYKKRSNVLGKKIKFSKNNIWSNAKALDIDEFGGLLVELEDGEKLTLNSGEISVRKID